jgi:hypothetical protein
MRSRCVAGIFHRSAVFNSWICFLVHLAIRPPNHQAAQENHIPHSHMSQKNRPNLRFNQLWKRYDGRNGWAEYFVEQVYICLIEPSVIE